MAAVAGRVDHVHARVGNEERPQLAAPFDDAAADWHVAFWRKCWDAGARTACVEYGPAPYQLTGDFRDLWLQNCAAKDHIEEAFAAWAGASSLSADPLFFTLMVEGRAAGVASVRRSAAQTPGE